MRKDKGGSELHWEVRNRVVNLGFFSWGWRRLCHIPLFGKAPRADDGYCCPTEDRHGPRPTQRPQIVVLEPVAIRSSSFTLRVQPLKFKACQLLIKLCCAYLEPTDVGSARDTLAYPRVRSDLPPCLSRSPASAPICAWLHVTNHARMRRFF